MTLQPEAPATADGSPDRGETAPLQDSADRVPARPRLRQRVNGVVSRVRPNRRLAAAGAAAVAVLAIVALVGAAQWPAPGFGAAPAPASFTAAPTAPASTAVATRSVPPATTPPTSTPELTDSPASTAMAGVLKPRPGQVFNHGDITRQEVFITVDDCRNWANIDKDLEVAHQNGVQITLFPAGKYIDAYEAQAETELRKAVAYGDEIENHTYTHTFIEPGTTGWKWDLDAQLATVRTALNDPGYREWFVRPPWGSGLDNTDFVTAAWKDGLAIALWSIDSSGYVANSTVPYAMHNIFETNHFKNGAIILLHDDDTDTAALPLIISTIQSKGFSIGGDLSNILIEPGPAGARVGGSLALSQPDPRLAIKEDDPPAA
jgi:peptidoglycan/xylan/chitin deacetylase (PgdA/CDA1 family)